MKRNELVAQLEAAKALTSVVSIDNVIALINSIEPEVREVKVVGINEDSFDKIMDKVNDGLRNLRTDRAVDFDSACFSINYNNQVELEDIELDTDFIENSIREELETLLDEEDEDDVVELEEGTLKDINQGLGLEPGGNPYAE